MVVSALSICVDIDGLEKYLTPGEWDTVRWLSCYGDGEDRIKNYFVDYFSSTHEDFREEWGI
jgi:hypothetical protein